MTTSRGIGVLALCGLLVLQPGAASLAQTAAPVAAPTPAPASEEEGGSRWPWVALAAVGAAAAIALLFAFVIVPSVGEDAGRAAANPPDGGGSPVLP